MISPCPRTSRMILRSRPEFSETCSVFFLLISLLSVVLNSVGRRQDDAATAASEEAFCQGSALPSSRQCLM